MPVIVIQPDTVKSMELCSNSPHAQNPFIVKHTTDQMPSQNSSKVTMIEMVELTPQKQLPERILYSAKNAKPNITLRKPKNNKYSCSGPQHLKVKVVESFPNCSYIINRTSQYLMLIM